MTIKQMKKLTAAFVLTTAALSTPIVASAHDGHGAHEHIAQLPKPINAVVASQPRVTLNGEMLRTSIAPQIIGGVTLVPMRDIFEALGATVVYVPETREIRARKGDTNVWLQIGNTTARVGETAQTLAEAPRVITGSTLVPLRFVSEALGADVAWDNVTRVVAISTDDRIVSTPDDTQTDVLGSLTIPAGAVVPVTLDSTLSSKDAHVGDKFTATVKSEEAGDSEFPIGTKLHGRVTEVQPLAEANPGVLGLEFTAAELPDGSRVALRGELTSLDDDSVTQNGGRILANKTNNNDKVKVIGIGAGAGFILGKILGKNSLITGILGAAGGYLYSKNKDKGKEQEAVVNAGSTLGVRLSQSVTYTDAGYADQRAPYLN